MVARETNHSYLFQKAASLPTTLAKREDYTGEYCFFLRVYYSFASDTIYIYIYIERERERIVELLLLSSSSSSSSAALIRFLIRLFFWIVI